MCLSKVYNTSDPDNIIMEYASKVDVDGDNITLTDVMGEEKTISGKLKFVDLTGAVIEIESV